MALGEAVALKAGATTALAGVTLSSIVYQDPNFLMSLVIGLLTGLAVFFLEYSHLDEDTKEKTNPYKVASTMLVLVLTVMGIVGSAMYGLEAYINTTDLELPKIAYVFPAILLGLAKKEVIGTFKAGLDAIATFMKNRSER